MRKLYTLLLFVAMATNIFAQVAPTFSTGTGRYYNPFSIELSGNEIYYTLDGTTPTKNSTKYTGTISIDEFGTTTTIKAASCVNDTWSEVVTATYELKVATPEFSVKSGVYEKLTNTEALEMTSSTTGATIYYNDRGADPIKEGSKLYGALSVLTTKTVKAVAFIKNEKGEKIYSDVASEYYVISPIALYYSANEITDGNKYIMNCDSKVASSFFENIESGDLNAIETTNKKGKYIETNEFNAFTFTSVAGGYTIQDGYNRYIYLNDNNKLNASNSKPATGGVWSVSIDKSTSQATITNVAKNKTIAYDTKNNIFGAYASITSEHKLPVIYKGIEYPTITITPADGDTLSEFSKFIVTCENGISYKESNTRYAYYNIGYDYSNKKEFDNIEEIDDNTIEFTLDEPLKSKDDYRIVFPANVFTLAPDGIAKKNKEIIARYTVENKDIFELTYANPDNKDVTDSLEYLYFEFNQAVKSNITNAVITDKKGNQYTLSVSEIDSWGEKCAENALCLKADEVITIAGEYTFILKKEHVCAMENNALTIDKDITYTFTVEEPLKISGITPNSSDIYDTVSEIELTFNKLALHSSIAEIVVTDSNNEKYIFTKTTTEEETKSLKFTTATPLTNGGTYSFTIDNAVIYCENANSDMDEIEVIPETTFTFIVKFPTSIESINAEAEKTEIYDLTGRRLEKITAAGIYIINNRKQVVK